MRALMRALMSVALPACALAVGAGPPKRSVLVLDQAGSRTRPWGRLPDGIHLVFLPPDAPELPPAAPRGQSSDQPLRTAHVPTIDALADAGADHCERLPRQRDVIRRAPRFHWWPAI